LPAPCYYSIVLGDLMFHPPRTLSGEYAALHGAVIGIPVCCVSLTTFWLLTLM